MKYPPVRFFHVHFVKSKNPIKVVSRLLNRQSVDSIAIELFRPSVQQSFVYGLLTAAQSTTDFKTSNTISSSHKITCTALDFLHLTALAESSNLTPEEATSRIRRLLNLPTDNTLNLSNLHTALKSIKPN